MVRNFRAVVTDMLEEAAPGCPGPVGGKD